VNDKAPGTSAFALRGCATGHNADERCAFPLIPYGEVAFSGIVKRYSIDVGEAGYSQFDETVL
jgi:hypothetical protein